ncbi:MAG: STAS domain-containing protein [Lachnospiraceae bacterium]|nr:STAS domain-containing protein [Lachnospiraceae bacterium]
MAAHLGIKLINRGEEGELLLKGRLDTSTAEEAATYFEAAAARFDHLILNMEELDYISSAGLRSMKRLHVQMQKKAGTLSVKSPNENIMEVFEMTGFAGLFNFI